MFFDHIAIICYHGKKKRHNHNYPTLLFSLSNVLWLSVYKKAAEVSVVPSTLTFSNLSSSSLRGHKAEHDFGSTLIQ